MQANRTYASRIWLYAAISFAIATCWPDQGLTQPADCSQISSQEILSAGPADRQRIFSRVVSEKAPRDCPGAGDGDGPTQVSSLGAFTQRFANPDPHHPGDETDRKTASLCKDRYAELNRMLDIWYASPGSSSARDALVKFDYLNFDADCLQKLAPTSAKLQSIQNKLGVLWNDSVRSNVVCTATLISPTHIITAAHCLKGVDPQGQTRRLTSADLSFSPLSAPQRRNRIDALHLHPRTDWVSLLGSRDPEQAFDYMILSLNTAEKYDPDLYIAAAQPQHENYIMPGYFWILAHRGDPMPTASAADTAAQAWPAAIRYGAPQSCRAHSINQPGCLAHSCQSVGGSSGAPLFGAEPDGRLRLIGIHSGEYLAKSCNNGQGRRDMARSEISRYPNLANTIDAQWVRDVLKQK